MESFSRYRYETKHLENGLTLLSMDLPHVHSLSIHAFVRSGPVYENRKINGVSHLLEHLHMVSTRRHPARADLAAAFDAFPGTRNAATTCDLIRFAFACAPAAGAPTAELVGDVLESRCFDPDTVDIEQDLIRSERETGREDFNNAVLRLLFKNHPFGLPAIGTLNSLRCLSPDELVRFDRASFRPDRIVIAIVGRLDSGVIEQAEARFGYLQAESDDELTEPPDPELCLPLLRCWNTNRNVKRINLGFVIEPSLSHAHRSAQWILNLAMQLPSFPLVHQLRYGDGNTYQFAYYQFRACKTKALLFQAMTRRADQDAFVTTILRELASMRDDGASVRAWLDNAKQVYRYHVETCLDSPERLAWRIGDAEVRKGYEPLISIEQELNTLDALRAKDVQALAIDMLRPDRIFLVFEATTRFRQKRRLWKRIKPFLS